MNTKTHILTAGAVAALLLGTATAHNGSPAGQEGARVHSRLEGPRMAGGGPSSRGMLRGGLPFGAPIGTEIDVRFYAEEPAEGVEPVTSLALTVGEDSEAAFMEAFAAAREDATHVIVDMGAQTRSVDLRHPETDEAGRTFRARPTIVLGMLNGAGLDDGDAVTVAFYDGDPDTGASELQTLTFTYGQDSAIGFGQDVRDAAETAEWAVVTLPPRTHTVDLSDVGNQDGMRPALGRFGPGGGGPVRR